MTLIFHRPTTYPLLRDRNLDPLPTYLHLESAPELNERQAFTKWEGAGRLVDKQ